MTKDTALRLALEALEKTQSALARCMGPHKSEEGDRHRALAYSRTTITAIKAALEAKDETVAWKLGSSGIGGMGVIVEPQRSESSGKPAAWVGLTDEEIQTIAFDSADRESAIIKANDKLRSKNEDR